MLVSTIVRVMETCRRSLENRWPDGLRDERGEVVEKVIIVAAAAVIAIAAMAAIAAAVDAKVGSIQL
jgi:hypothetical protein